MAQALRGLSNDNSQGEYYLTDAVALLAAKNGAVEAIEAEDWREGWGINTRRELAAAAVAESARRVIARRSEICLERQIGLTELYNEVDDGAYRDLRELPVALDEDADRLRRRDVVEAVGQVIVRVGAKVVAAMP